MKERKHSSSCCGADVTVVGGDEGTNHWECTKCNKSCNDTYYFPKPDKTVKKSISRPKKVREL